MRVGLLCLDCQEARQRRILFSAVHLWYTPQFEKLNIPLKLYRIRIEDVPSPQVSQA